MKFGYVKFLVLGVLALTAAGCSSNPLVGRWTATNSGGGVQTTVTMTLGGGGNADATIVGMGACTGTMTFTGATWTSTATAITFAGMSTCAGMVMCTIAGTTVNVDCSMAGNLNATSGTHSYTLSNSNMTLVVDTSTFTRAS